ncbi:ABC transporter substrate-binding protein [Streptomyces sp. 7-21]|jgi:sulfonate transport system substrate-binding protein|uniref:ABC transporter substrate-binding protein n=1 Tax=Streptomyces sp. 7-21 TaxID=2802283 RepID=UPI00191F636D|nr:ABC transporter substrate-binding protein [Streptomyces sp. 7-21]MBL1065247.1 ABC transporter substrate-binding protein [Streptomyces sp. 7-21]
MPLTGTPVRPARLAALALLVPLLLTGCANETQDPQAAAAELADTEIPTTVNPDVTLTIGAPDTEVALELSGLIDELDFNVEWAEMSGGPQCSEAFRADALDVCSAAEVPSIHAHWTGLDTKLVAAEFRRDPVEHPIYELGIAPGADIQTLEDLRGKRIAFSPGQAQGALVLRILDKAGLTTDDVELVELPSTGDVYPTALGNGEVDAAPIGSVNIRRYLDQYGPDGGTTIHHGLRDDPTHLWVPTSVVADPEKAAAIRQFVQVWARAQVWINEHPEEWIQGYYIEDQGLSYDDGAYLVEQEGDPDIPADWSDAIERHQQTIDLLAAELGNEPFDAELLYDRRFESVGAEAIGGTP